MGSILCCRRGNQTGKGEGRKGERKGERKEREEDKKKKAYTLSDSCHYCYIQKNNNKAGQAMESGGRNV